MPWGRIDDGLYDHPKVDALPGGIRLACMGLNTLAISWSNRFLTDGFVPDERIRKLGGRPAHKAALIAVGLWETADGGAIIHDFHVYNPTREGILTEREAARQRMQNTRRSRNVQTHTGRSSGEVREKFGTRSRAPSESRPDPSQGTPQPPQEGEHGSRANGTSPRQIASRDQKARASKRQAIELAYYRGEMTEAQKRDALRDLGYAVDEPASWFDATAPAETPA